MEAQKWGSREPTRRARAHFLPRSPQSSLVVAPRSASGASPYVQQSVLETAATFSSRRALSSERADRRRTEPIRLASVRRVMRSLLFHTEFPRSLSSSPPPLRPLGENDGPLHPGTQRRRILLPQSPNSSGWARLTVVARATLPRELVFSAHSLFYPLCSLEPLLFLPQSLTSSSTPHALRARGRARARAPRTDL